jgi:integrase
LATAPDYIRVLVTLILEAGLRSRSEALALKWKDVDFHSGTIQVVESKTIAGRRSVPMSSRCKTELLAWRGQAGHDLSAYVFANPQSPEAHLVDVRVAWAKTLKDAGLEYFWIYDLRHAFTHGGWCRSDIPGADYGALQSEYSPDLRQSNRRGSTFSDHETRESA